MRKRYKELILILVFLVGLSVLLYPSVSDYVNRRNQSRVITQYDDVVDSMPEKAYAALLEAASEYNEELADTPSAFYDPDEIPGYDELLDVEGTGLIGYVTIERLGIMLPIYHGVSDSVLQSAAGHLPGTSLPVGGESTHSVISAHRGLPSASLFTDLDKMKKKDTFTIKVLDLVLTYEVDLISVVDPEDVDLLQIEKGKDYCTLMTCTPYGVNSQRLLVRGHRIATPEDTVTQIDVGGIRVDSNVNPLTVIIPSLAFIILLFLLIRKRK